MKTTKRVIILVCSVFLVAALFFVSLRLFQKHFEKSALQEVTIIQLLASPEKYDGKRVRVIAVGNLEFEGDGLYLGKEDLLYYTGNCIWLDFVGNTIIPYEEIKQYNGKYVIVEGIFHKDDFISTNGFHGKITDITRYDLWRTEAELVETENAT